MVPKTTHSIRRKTVQANFRAFDFAIHKGKAFNRYIVINMTDPEDGLIWAKYLKKYRRWLEHKRTVVGHDDSGRLRPCHIYARENDNGLHHVNWVVWVPPELLEEFDRKVTDWALKIGSAGRFDIKNQAVKPGTEKTIANYMNKDCEEAFRDHFHLGHLPNNPGEVRGPRTGMSPSIAATAQKNAGFVARRDRRRRAA